MIQVKNLLTKWIQVNKNLLDMRIQGKKDLSLKRRKKNSPRKWS